MKKIITLVLSAIMAIVSVFALTGCGEDQVVKIGVQKGTTSLMYADCLKGTECVSYDTFALAVNDMKNGNVDYVFCDKATALSLCDEISGIKYVNISLSSEVYGIGVDKNQAGLKDTINTILADKAAEIDAIMNKYMQGNEAEYVGVTSATKDVNKASQQLVVATNAEFAPWEYKQGNKYYGIDMEIAKILADELNMELVIDNMEFDAVVGAVGNHGVDIAMSGLTITSERKNVINFSNPYYTDPDSGIVVLCKANDTSLDDAITAVDLLNIICVNK